jgi:hypothetical protein
MSSTEDTKSLSDKANKPITGRTGPNPAGY